jgi:hypothetical protein
MKQKILSHYMALGPRRFVIGTVLILIILDILSGYYLKVSWDHKNFYGQAVDFWIKSLKLDAGDISAATMGEILGLIRKSFDLFLVLVFLNNLFFYFFYLKKKLWAQGYILFYTITGSLMSLFMVFDNMGMGWISVNLMSSAIYFYLFLGVKLLKHQTTSKEEKKAQ